MYLTVLFSAVLIYFVIMVDIGIYETFSLFKYEGQFQTLETWFAIEDPLIKENFCTEAV